MRMETFRPIAIALMVLMFSAAAGIRAAGRNRRTGGSDAHAPDDAHPAGQPDLGSAG